MDEIGISMVSYLVIETKYLFGVRNSIYMLDYYNFITHISKFDDNSEQYLGVIGKPNSALSISVSYILSRWRPNNHFYQIFLLIAILLGKLVSQPLVFSPETKIRYLIFS